MPNLYKEVKNLFETSNEAIEMYMKFKSCTREYSEDRLFIYETTREAEKEFWKYITRCRGVTYNTDRRRIFFPGNKKEKDETIYFKSINECKRELDGYRFKEIQFRGEEYGS